MKTLYLCFYWLIICVLIHPSNCLGQEPPQMLYDLDHSDIKVMEVSNNVSIMYGGIGRTERTLMDQLSSDYNLKLVFTALPSNKYLSNVVINILNNKDQTILHLVSEGPLFFAKLIPGIYSIKAVYHGKETLVNHIEVKKVGQKVIHIGWKINNLNH